MLDLFRSELRRLRNAVAIYAAAHLAVLVLLQQMLDIATGFLELHLLLLIAAMLSGLGLAIYQFGSYRQPSRWIWLLHRPLPRARILAALVLAAGVAIALAVGLPLLVMLLTQQHFTRHVIDGRHYAGAAFLALSALSAWLAGGTMMLHRSRWAFVVLILPIVLTLRLASAPTVIALSLACNLVLLFLLYAVFRPNRASGDDVATTVASALPMQICFYLALAWGGSMVFQIGQMLVGVHPLSTDKVPHGGLTEATRATAVESLQAGLASSTDPRAAHWRTALMPEQSVTSRQLLRQHPVHNLLTTKGALTINRSEDRWTFSHDRMLYRATNRRTHADLGWIGAPGPFAAQPTLLVDDRRTMYLATPHDLYAMTGDTDTMRHVLHAGGSEQLGGGLMALDKHLLLLTNRRLILLPSAADATAAAEVRLPAPFGDLERLDAAEVADGTLVSFVFGHRQLDGVDAAPQVVYLVDAAGHAREVGRRALTHDFPSLFEHKDWWLSPALHALVALPALLIDNGTVPDDGAFVLAPLQLSRPPAVWCAAIVAALLSAGGGWLWMRQTRATPAARLAWCLACLLLGLPALLSLMVLQPRVLRALATVPRQGVTP